jgi:hypothetical protein
MRPDQKAMVYTGYAHPALVAEIESMGIGPCLVKPTPLPELARVIRDQLDAP